MLGQDQHSTAMRAVNQGVLSIIALGCYVATSISTTAPTTEPLPTQLQTSSPTSSLNTSTVDCAVDCKSPFNRYTCRCDEQLCTQFGNCCAESNYTHNTTGPEFTCASTSVLEEGRNVSTSGYFMIASCPESQLHRAIMKGLAELCEAQSLFSPPISDNRTGLVYRNKYCAQCHGVPEKEQISWRSEWRCNDSLQETFKAGNPTIDAELLLSSCNVSCFVQP